MAVLPVSPEGYEDWLRHKADNEVNGAPVFVVRSGSLVQTRSKNIRVRWFEKNLMVDFNQYVNLNIPYDRTNCAPTRHMTPGCTIGRRKKSVVGKAQRKTLGPAQGLKFHLGL